VDFCLTDEQVMIKNTARKFAENEIMPVISEYDEREEFPLSLFKKMQDTGLANLAVPAEFGGPGIDYLGQALALEEIARGDLGLATSIVASCLLAVEPMNKVANPEQRQKWWKGILAGKIGAFCLTEPVAGSDVSSIATICKKVDGGYILNGTKCFITNGAYAGQFTVFATLDKKMGHNGLCAFMVDRDTAGVSVGKIERKMGLRTSNTSEIIFENVFVPEENRLGEEGSGFLTCMKMLDYSRPMIAAIAVGCAQGAFEYALEYSQQRVQFGKSISSFQSIQFMLADALMNIEAGRLLYTKACLLKMAGKPFSQAASIAKAYCGDMAMKVTTDMVQIYGGYGYIRDYPVEKYMRDAKVLQIFEGTSQIQRMVIAANLLKGMR
jgi:acyl-CoA dehydrogenase